ncbi:molybdenum cofactor guanylyltransferase [Virgisporangium aliadipatigenens]|uniref:Molybdenum cofactor guanylyltransferase n=1 Tax=Virgisporangium aliadipatigenens TaxID=741659 RepID=A0A8J3YP79_9ACTN|nr:NTP transferase domain-containing protein [Virgisporangium aliadipatigenens]GIJ47273.1 molybdenum cofactor guanylyltransferase [Virgisporangium aliadipatigenens]
MAAVAHGYAAIVLAGGGGRRLGGPAKPTLEVAGVSMLARVLDAVADAAIRVVVGPAELEGLLPDGVVLTREEPPGGGPVAALWAGLSALDGEPAQARPEAGGLVAVLAADLPLLTRGAVGLLLRAVSAPAAGGERDGAVFVDGDGRQQFLCGAWAVPALRTRLGHLAPHAGLSLRQAFAPMRVAEVVAPPGTPPPWYDCDTAEELAEARRLWGEVHGDA